MSARIWVVDDDRSVRFVLAAALREKGVEFEEYDMPGLKTTAGVAESGGMRSAWFKDPDGNILALAEMG